MKLSSVILRSKWYLAGFLVFITALLLVLAVYGKANGFILLNSYHSGLLDGAFTVYTYAGDGIFAICIAVLFFFIFKRKQEGLALLFAYILSGLLAQLIKNFVFSPRPRMLFTPAQYQYFIEGVSHTGNSSFPSGHTATAFALATVIAMYTQNGKMQLLILLAAILVGYSRIYLGQHFLLDVGAGSVIGLITAILSLYLASKIKKFGPGIGSTNKLTPQTIHPSSTA